MTHNKYRYIFKYIYLSLILIFITNSYGLSILSAKAQYSSSVYTDYNSTGTIYNSIQPTHFTGKASGCSGSGNQKKCTKAILSWDKPRFASDYTSSLGGIVFSSYHLYRKSSSGTEVEVGNFTDINKKEYEDTPPDNPALTYSYHMTATYRAGDATGSVGGYTSAPTADFIFSTKPGGTSNTEGGCEPTIQVALHSGTVSASGQHPSSGKPDSYDLYYKNDSGISQKLNDSFKITDTKYLFNIESARQIINDIPKGKSKTVTYVVRAVYAPTHVEACREKGYSKKQSVTFTKDKDGNTTITAVNNSAVAASGSDTQSPIAKKPSGPCVSDCESQVGGGDNWFNEAVCYVVCSITQFMVNIAVALENLFNNVPL